jgi:kinesin family protein 5
MATSCNVRVCARFRPFNKREYELDCVPVHSIHGEQRVDVQAHGSPRRSYAFDRVYGEHSTQREVYDLLQDTTLDVMKGYNGTIFAYGQTGSGKTHTMMGPDINDPSLKGVIPNAIDHIFECIAADTTGAEISLGVSYMEVYKEVIRDLLDPSKIHLQVGHSAS